MLNKFTFGNTPAAIYLSDTLNQIGNKKFTRKISKTVVELRTIIGELIIAHQQSAISTHTLSCMIEYLNEKIERSLKFKLWEMLNEGGTDTDALKQLAINLMANVLKGEVKSINRRSRKVSHLEKEQRKLIVGEKISIRNKDRQLLGYEVGFEPHKINIEYISEEINSKSLQVKSKNKLKRLGKKCELY